MIPQNLIEAKAKEIAKDFNDPAPATIAALAMAKWMQEQESKPEAMEVLDEEGFFFFTKSFEVAWCRMWGDTAWFFSRTPNGWVSRKQANQTDVWSAGASKITGKVAIELLKDTQFL